MTPETQVAVQAFEALCKAERNVERKRLALRAAVVRVPFTEMEEYAKVTTEIKDRYDS